MIVFSIPGVEPVSDMLLTSAPYLTKTSTTRYFPATEAHHKGVTLCTDLFRITHRFLFLFFLIDSVPVILNFVEPSLLQVCITQTHQILHDLHIALLAGDEEGGAALPDPAHQALPVNPLHPLYPAPQGVGQLQQNKILCSILGTVYVQNMAINFFIFTKYWTIK